MALAHRPATRSGMHSHNTTLQQKRASERHADCLLGTEAHGPLQASTEALTSAFAWLAAIAPPALGQRLGLHSACRARIHSRVGVGVGVGVGGMQSMRGMSGAARWAWAWSLVQSRAFNLRAFAKAGMAGSTGSVSLDSAAMVPLIDMANHAGRPGAVTATVMVEGGAVVLRASRGVERGGELRISYGHGRGHGRGYGHSDSSGEGEGENGTERVLTMSSVDSFIRYGFVTDEVWNSADTVLLQIPESNEVNQSSDIDDISEADIGLKEQSEYDMYFGDGAADAWLLLGHGATAEVQLRKAVRSHGGERVREALLSRLSRYTIQCKEHVEQPCGCTSSRAWSNCEAAHKLACDEQRLLQQALRRCDELIHEEKHAEL